MLKIYNLHRCDSRLEAAAWPEADDPHAACTLWTNLQEGHQYGMATMKAERADIRFIHLCRDMRFHFTLLVIASVDQCLQHERGRFIVRTADAYAERAGGTAQLGDGFLRPADDFVQDDLGVMLVEDAERLRADGGAAAEHQDMELKAVAFRPSQKKRRGQDACGIRIQAARLVDTLFISALDAHGAAGQSPQSDRHALVDGVQKLACHDGVPSRVENKMRDSRVVA